MATFDAVFVGLTILDIAGRPVIDIPPRGGVAFIEQIRLNPAGTAAGANINAAKLGIRTAAVACLGEDEKADFILASYARLGIDCSLIQRTAQQETSATILPIRPNGERPALHCRGASDALFVGEEEFDAILDCRFLHHGGSGLLAAMDSGQSALLLQAAKARGVTTSFDLIAPDARTLDLLRPLLPSVDYFMPSLEEAAYLSGETQPEAIARVFFALGVGTCILKDGENGSWLLTRDGAIEHIAPYRVDAVDTTGCGDSYCGGFIAALARGLSVKAACEVASAVAALVATGMGSDAVVVDWQHTQAFMATHRRG
ncbi:carbohydrate kinase family protein [Klebsiella grimontii]|uniref:carbohydrate kinase family protein n=1 Tax=Klebsiella grimontii TaxID=2058152 RepID=UPI001CCE9F50|nr:sugar kinase [Klebsiella grimontii]MBZ7670527.1 sugar kinase [Klebsiella grimontii]